MDLVQQIQDVFPKEIFDIIDSFNDHIILNERPLIYQLLGFKIDPIEVFIKECKYGNFKNLKELHENVRTNLSSKNYLSCISYSLIGDNCSAYRVLEGVKRFYNKTDFTRAIYYGSYNIAKMIYHGIGRLKKKQLNSYVSYDKKCIKFLLELKADPKHIFSSCLDLAIEDDDLDLIKTFVSYGLDLTNLSKNYNSRSWIYQYRNPLVTALKRATITNNLDVVNCLLNVKADPTDRNMIQEIVRDGNTNILDLLHKIGICDCEYYLDSIICKDDRNMFEHILSKGVQIDLEKISKQACYRGSLNIIKYLHEKNKLQLTSEDIITTIYKNHSDVLSFFLELNFFLNDDDKQKIKEDVDDFHFGHQYVLNLIGLEIRHDGRCFSINDIV